MGISGKIDNSQLMKALSKLPKNIQNNVMVGATRAAANVIRDEARIRVLKKTKDLAKSIVSITEANQNFSKVARLVDELGSAVIMKNNVPKYLVIEFVKADNQENASDESVMALSRKLMEANKEAYEVLAK